ncbi:hypothetical protein DP092_23980 [Pseudomonas sp. MDMC224]|nr:hypothetical protein DP092_23980 [Pseudomonas sp. MDMC224]
MQAGEQGAQVADLLAHGRAVGGELWGAGVDLGMQDGHRWRSDFDLIAPTLCVGVSPGTLSVPRTDAERPVSGSHAERGNHHRCLTWSR